MICRKCNAKIADKAIVCYRCGTPTAEPAAITPPATGRPSVVGWLSSLALAMVAFGFWWLVPGPPTDTTHLVAAAVAVLTLLFAVVRFVRSRR